MPQFFIRFIFLMRRVYPIPKGKRWRSSGKMNL
ncbi:hypothetical protein LINGRAPRIM_LOCUS431 [Linum grandiflorum]